MLRSLAIYPGTFDPPTYGHLDLINRASKIFDKLIIAVAASYNKNVWFDVAARVSMLQKITKKLNNVTIDSFDELLVEYARKKGAKVLVRGIRALSDFEYEFQMALTNRGIAPDIETVFMMPHESYSYLSSSLIKEIVYLGGNVKKFVPSEVEQILRRHKKDKINED